VTGALVSLARMWASADIETGEANVSGVVTSWSVTIQSKGPALRVRVCGPFRRVCGSNAGPSRTRVVLTMSDETVSDLRSNIGRLLG
jgi:hypothetical protein